MKKQQWLFFIFLLIVNAALVIPVLATSQKTDVAEIKLPLILPKSTSIPVSDSALVRSRMNWLFLPPIQTTINEWIVWETAIAPQSLLLEGDTIWVGGRDSLHNWDVTAGYQSTYTTSSGLVGKDVVALALTGSGDKLVATLDGGLSIGNSTFGSLTPLTELAWDLAVESNGTSFWLATLGNGVSRYDNSIWTTYDTLSSTLPFNDIYAIAVDSADTPWIGTLGYGVAWFDGSDWVTYTLPVSVTHPVTSALTLGNQAVNDIVIDSNGNKWFATDGSGVVVLDSTNSNWTVYDTSNSSLPDNFVYAIMLDGDNRWFGTLGGGVARLDTSDNSWEVFNTANSPLPDDDVLATTVDGNSGLWFATYDSGLTYHGPLPAIPPLYDMEVHQAPYMLPGQEKVYSLWLDPSTYTWYLSWTGDGEAHTFTGSIVANGPVLSATSNSLEPGDTIAVMTNTLSISATEVISQDIVSFVLDRSVTELTVDLKIDGAYRPFNIQVGGESEVPATAPFRVETPQPVAPQVQVLGSQVITEGDSLFLSGQYTDTDSFSGHEFSWNLGDGTIVTDTLYISHVYADNGVFNITLTVTDVHQVVGSYHIPVTVTNDSPVVFFRSQAPEPTPGEIITFTGYIIDSGLADTHTYHWDFGDGVTQTDNLTVTHIYTQVGTFTTTLTVTDDDGGIGVVRHGIDIFYTAPTPVDDTAVTPEDTTLTVDVLANDSDPNNAPLTVVSVTTPTNGVAIVNTDSTIAYTPTANFNGLDTFTYVISNSSHLTSSAQVSITVTPVNDAPTAVGDTATTLEDTAVTVDVLTNDSDIDGDALSVVAVTQPGNGTVTLNPDYTITYTPTLDYNSTDSPNGIDSFTYTARDSNGATAIATVEITVTPVNDPPSAEDDEVTINEDNPVTIDVLANDSDVDGDTIQVTGVTSAGNGVTVINPDSSIAYTPTTNFYGTDTFVYTISDNQGLTDTATVTVLVTPLNDPPTAENDMTLTDEDTAVTIAVLTNDSDVDGDTVSLTALTVPDNGTAVINPDDTVTYTPTADFNGSDSFAYTISDGQGGEDTAVVMVTVNPINDMPVAAADAVATAEDTTTTIDVLANDSDIDGDALTVTAVTSPTNGTAVINPDNTVTYTPTANFGGVDSFAYTISDGQGGSDTAIVTITVTSENDNPVATDDSATTDEDVTLTVNVLANDTDVDGDILSVSTVTQPNNGLVVINPDGTVTYTPTTNFNGSDSFVYTVSDGNGGSDTATVTIVVDPINDAPVAINDNATTNEDLPVTVDVLANDSDVDGDSLTVTGVTLPTQGIAVINPDNTVTYTPTANYYGADIFTYTVTDGNGGSNVASVNITISPVNDAPVALNDAVATDEDIAVTVAVLANDTDVDGDTLTVTAVTTPTNGSIVLNGDDTITYTPDPDTNGADSFSYTVIDGQGGSDTANVIVAVNPVNDVPIAVSDTITTGEDMAVLIEVLANDSDVDGDTLTVESITPPANGTAVIQPDNTIVYTPTVNFNGIDTFLYTINDGYGSISTAMVTVNVLPVNDAPQALDDATVTPEDTAVTVVVLANDSDIDGDLLTVTSVTTPTNGTVVINSNNSVTYTPSPNFNGVDNFLYTISDGNGGFATALVTITISSKNDNPEAMDDVATTDEETAVTIAVLDNDVDLDGDTITVTAVTMPTNGMATLNPDNTITYTPTTNFNGSDNFAYSISDGFGGSDTALVTITVLPVNDAPVAIDDSAALDQDTTVTINVLANDNDVDGDPLNVISVSVPGNGSVLINSDNTLTYTPNPNFVGVDSFTYTISDGQGGTDTATVTLSVLPVYVACNLYPIAVSHEMFIGADVGDIFPNILNGEQPGNFGWLTWNGNNGVPALIASLTPPGNSHIYINPNDPADHIVSIGDWVEGKPGVANAKGVRDALDMLIGTEIVVPTWNIVQGNGANTTYEIAGFVKIRLLAYNLPGQDQITAEYRGVAYCLDE